MAAAWRRAFSLHRLLFTQQSVVVVSSSVVTKFSHEIASCRRTLYRASFFQECMGSTERERLRERETGERSYAREQVSSDTGSVSDGLS
jgi:hypothetical protein